MKTVCIQIGNSDNKLTQEEWAEFVQEIESIVNTPNTTVHFFGGSPSFETWQNACCVLEVDGRHINSLKRFLINCRKKYKQDSIAILEGETQFI